MNESIALLLDWVLAIFHHWEAIVAFGVVPFVIDLLDRFWEWKMPKKWYAVFVLLGLVAAMHMAWREEREKAVNAAHQLDELTKPILSAWFVSERTVSIAPEDPNSTELIMGLNIVNTGAPTALIGFNARILMANGKQIDVTPVHRTVKPLVITDALGKSQQLAPSDYLPEKAGETPLAHNGRVQGYIPYVIRGVNARDFAAMRSDISVVFADVNGKSYAVTGTYGPRPQ